MASATAKKRIETIGNLPTLPEIAHKLLQLVHDPSTSASDVAELISRDPSLTSKVLRLANSAFYGIPRTITTVHNAVVILGLKVVSTLVLSISLVELFPNDGKEVSFERKQFWAHSLGCALISKLLARQARKFNLFDPEECFCAGLLHDIGKLVMDQFFHDDFVRALRSSQDRKVHLALAEKEELGFDHSELGDALMDKWQLPMELRIPILYHHAPDDAPSLKEIASVIHFADHLCHSNGMVMLDDGFPPPFFPDATLYLGLDEQIIIEIVEKAQEEAEKLQVAFRF